MLSSDSPSSSASSLATTRPSGGEPVEQQVFPLRSEHADLLLNVLARFYTFLYVTAMTKPLMILIAGPYRSGTGRRPGRCSAATSTGWRRRPGRSSAPGTCR